MTERIAGFGASTLRLARRPARVMRAHGAERPGPSSSGPKRPGSARSAQSFVARSRWSRRSREWSAVLAVLALILLGRQTGLSLAELAALAVVSTRLLSSAQNLLELRADLRRRRAGAGVA